MSAKPTGSEVRSMFLRFFEQKGHKIVHSSSLVPHNDPTLLFTNAGMNQFKDVFLGIEKRDYNRATSSQTCVRAGGKHNDLENVGFTNRHHTFFEMLGNFSFGDYFKKDAIAFAWELVTSAEWFGIAKDKLYVTIFKGEQGVPRDNEAYHHWMDTDVDPEHIKALGMKDNFWQMGDTGPCGPCSELHYDMGPAASDAGHTDCEFGCECGRYVEIWNLVFMQFNRIGEGEQFFDPEDGTFKYPAYRLEPLPKPSIDTGAGLERVTAVLQGVISNYDTDLFVPLIKRAWELTSIENNLADPRVQASLRIIADHSRAATFLISDGVLPSNEGRGYVLRKIMRRAFRHGKNLGVRPGVHFLSQMVYAVVKEMADAYPELLENRGRVAKVVAHEEERFWNTIEIGMKGLEEDFTEFSEYTQELAELRVRMQAQQEFDGHVHPKTQAEYDSLVARRPSYSGEKAFKLYDTFGLPRDFIEDAARDVGIKFDAAGFDAAMEEQRRRAQASWKGGAKATANPEFLKYEPTEFTGYHQTYAEHSSVRGIYIPGGPLTRALLPGQEGEIILDRTPFYADSGGQVGDVGWLYDGDGNTIVADVLGCLMPVQGVRFHKVRARAKIEIGDLVNPKVNEEVRRATMRNHTGTHLLHAALREVLGTHVKQAGSLVDPGHLRFDFSHFASLTDEELQDIEDLANREVLRNDLVEVIPDVPYEEATKSLKAIALFDEKYGDRVRVIRIGDFSTELCGGTHTAATGEIGLIKVLKEGSVSSGVRRLEAVTGEGSLRHFRKDHQLEQEAARLVGAAQRRMEDANRSVAAEYKKMEEASAAVAAAQRDMENTNASVADALRQAFQKRDEEIKRLKRELEQARMKAASVELNVRAGFTTEADVIPGLANVRDVKGVKVLARRLDNLERAQLRTLIDNLRNKLGSGVVVLGSVSDGKVALIVGVTKDLTSRVQAGKIIAEVAKKVGGSGGGRPDMAEAGGKDPAALDSALAESYDVVGALLG